MVGILVSFWDGLFSERTVSFREGSMLRKCRYELSAVAKKASLGRVEN